MVGSSVKPVEQFTFLATMAAATGAWLAIQSSISPLNWIALGFILFGIAIGFEIESVRETFRDYRRNKLIKKLTSIPKA